MARGGNAGKTRLTTGCVTPPSPLFALVLGATNTHTCRLTGWCEPLHGVVLHPLLSSTRFMRSQFTQVYSLNARGTEQIFSRFQLTCPAVCSRILLLCAVLRFCSNDSMDVSLKTGYQDGNMVAQQFFPVVIRGTAAKSPIWPKKHFFP